MLIPGHQWDTDGTPTGHQGGGTMKSLVVSARNMVALEHDLGSGPKHSDLAVEALRLDLAA